MKLGIAEILNKAGQLKTKKEKVEYLRTNDSRPLQDIIQYALHPEITWDLPSGDPPYTPCPYLDQENMLYSQARTLYLFVNGRGSNLRPAKLETLFIELLESVSPADAQLLLLVKNRKLPKGISKDVIEEVWPGLIPNEQAQKVS